MASSEEQKGKKYQASCHCGANKYAVTVPRPLDDPAATVIDCNCSICIANGALNVHADNSDVEFEGEGLAAPTITKYTFGSNRIQHYFCNKCGSSLMAESIVPGFFVDKKAINVRMFHGIDVDKLNKERFDGKTLL